jgi:hypothetical protein
MRFHKKLRNKKLDFNDDLEKWLGESLVKEGNRLINNCPDKDDLIIRYLIAKKNWLISLQEIKELDVQINILKRD